MSPERERETVIALLDAAVLRLAESVDERLIPPEGAAFAYAIRGARDRNGAASVPGGIGMAAGKARVTGASMFGRDDPAVRAILTAMKFDQSVRSAAILRYSDRVLQVLEDDLFLECASFSASRDPKGIDTMDWGIAFCCREGIPDVIYEKTAAGPASRLVLFGEDPDDVASNIIICSNRI